MKTGAFKTLSAAAADHVLIAAHRGISGGNIPCNTIAAFEIALRQGADIIELDVQKSSDGALWVFHEGKESPHLCALWNYIADHDSAAIRHLRYVNQDDDETQFGVERLEEVLDFLKDRCFINLDHCWNFFPEVAELVRRKAMTEQCLLKTNVSKKDFEIIRETAPDIPFMPILTEQDDGVSEFLASLGINYVGNEVVFSSLESQLARPEYIEKMHRNGKILWVNAIIFSYKRQLAGGLSDDFSLQNDPAQGWGRLADMGYDIIQTDWVQMLREHLQQSGKYCR